MFQTQSFITTWLSESQGFTGIPTEADRLQKKQCTVSTLQLVNVTRSFLPSHFSIQSAFCVCQGICTLEESKKINSTQGSAAAVVDSVKRLFQNHAAGNMQPRA